MPPADNTPDFDSMSPEELMAWMESLAKRQGASEGFTTAADMQIAEVDPDTVDIDEPGYVPYGMDPEKWKVKQAEEAAKKAAALPPAPAPVPAQSAPPPPPPAPMPEPVMQAAAPPASDAAPDFDSMSPEEMMAWMESLAKRQGAVEGFTTAADMQIADVDPDTVIDEPGYVPYGMDPEKWKVKQAEEAAKKAAALPPAPAPVPAQSAPPPAPLPEPEPELTFELPQFDMEEDIASTQLAEPAGDDALAWLESLAADQGSSFQPVDLAALDAGLEPLASQTAEQTDPLAWLESLAQNDSPVALPTTDDIAPQDSGVSDPLETGTDPVTWLESLAKRQGASEDTLVTSADLSIPLPQDIADTGPGYQDYAFEEEDGPLPDSLMTDFAEPAGSFADPDNLEEPEAWLESLASAQGFKVKQEEKPAEEAADILDALNSGKDVSPDAMQAWMNRQFDRAETVEEVEEVDFDPNAEAIKADLPDWLLEQMGPPPDIEAQTVPEEPALVEDIVSADMPDWLQESEPAQSDLPDWLSAEPEPANDLPDWLATEEAEESVESIFAQPQEAPVVSRGAPPAGDVVDMNDPWVVAFEQERTSGQIDIENPPDWYRRRLDGDADTQPEEELPAATAAPAAGLQAAGLPEETELAAGELQAMPDWLADTSAQGAPVETAAFTEAVPDWLASEEPTAEPVPDWLSAEPDQAQQAAVSSDLPDWLREASVTVDDVPDWLKETLTTGEQHTVPAAPPPIVSAPPPAASPAPIPPAARIDVSAALNNARSKFNSGDIDGCLVEYEAVIRANAQIDTVISDLAKVIEDKKHKENPAVYRVLGDGLMRQGKLQAALDTYRKALNLL